MNFNVKDFEEFQRMNKLSQHAALKVLQKKLEEIKFRQDDDT